MAARENVVFLEGNLATDPELRHTNSGIPVTTLVLATNERTLVDGQWTDGPTSYFDCVVWNQMALHCTQSFTRGDRVQITGRLNQRSWDDKATGQRRYKIEIIADTVGASLRFATVTATKQAFGTNHARPTTVAASAHIVNDGPPIYDEQPF